jgi:hypothetical protein
MSNGSKDILDEVIALNAIREIETEKELRAFIKGESREALLDAAEYRINVLRPKQGQTGPITQKTEEFKGGIEGTKEVESVQGDVVDGPKDYITIEDVLARQKGLE